MSGTAGVVEETTAQGFWDCSPMKPRTRPCAIPWAAGDGQHQAHTGRSSDHQFPMCRRTRQGRMRIHGAVMAVTRPAWKGKAVNETFRGIHPRPAAPVAFILPEGGRGTFKPIHHQESHGLSILGKQP